ncbi:MAG: septum site-determining protein MinC [Candidatus Accumulibacter sp.]|uniref:septum site-determining protein MinC n=1 Tax=Accumulibacter sp. TaxID=2053492 RepID=UPI00287AF620|nr:septum site-determining protein MinC [Accumulibacter sp.]MDS4015722.1 septum site-determining protein MinC [Accumulibacter sp.]
MQTRKSHQLIEFKGTTLPVVVVTLRSLVVEDVAVAARELFGDDPFFDGDPALLELAALADADAADWQAIAQTLRTHGLNLIGVRGGSEALRTSAAASGLPTYATGARAANAAAATDTAEARAAVDEALPAATAAAAPPESPETPAAPASAPAAAAKPPLGPLPTLFIDRPLRSGQQVYARGSNLVILGAVNAGAEVIADGSIHIYAPLRGRALAGAAGDTGARILCTRFDAELVSIAGLYRTFDGGVPAGLAGQAVQVRLAGGSDDEAGKLLVEPLKTD